MRILSQKHTIIHPIASDISSLLSPLELDSVLHDRIMLHNWAFLKEQYPDHV